MNGGGACFFRSFVATDRTTKLACSRSDTTAVASASRVTFSACVPFLTTLVSNSGGTAPASRAKRCQYSSATNRSISASRSHTSFSATDWTRPALRPRRTLSHNSGLSLYPTIRSSTRRACCASTIRWSIERSSFNASSTACLVISLNSSRPILRPFAPSSLARCQPMASPSRSGSVATKIWVTPLAASRSCLMTFLRAGIGS